MRPALLVVGSFAAMEAVSYAAHRWVMHGFAMGWHRSHHRRSTGRFERNDLFPLCFSVVGVALFAVPALGWAADLLWVGIGVAAYGACYLFVHDVYIHRRLPAGLPRLPYLEWLRERHQDHHRTGGEPYGMLLPLNRRAPAAPADRRRPQRPAGAPPGGRPSRPSATSGPRPGR